MTLDEMTTAEKIHAIHEAAQRFELAHATQDSDGRDDV